MKVLGICGSPRAGNSKFLPEQALSSAREAGEAFGMEVETEFWTVRGKKISGCVMCDGCAKDGKCIIKDDFQEISGKWRESDVVLYSIPVYHMGIPAQLKAFIDRIGNSFFGCYADKFPENAATLPKSLKTIGCIAQGIHVFSGQEHTIAQIVNHALLMGCIPVTGDMWQSYIGAGGWTCNDAARDAIKRQYLEKKQDAIIAVDSARAVAKRAVEIAAVLKWGGKALFQKLSQDPVYTPFLEKLVEK
jgi:multimeric flavodoxin WrbA